MILSHGKLWKPRLSARIQVGEQLKVIGIGDDPEASILSPVPLSSVQVPFFEIGRVF